MAKQKTETLEEKHEPSVAQTDDCVRCHRELGAKHSIMPFDLDGIKYCPRCFVYHESKNHTERFYSSDMHPVYCNRCGTESLAVGTQKCSYCGFRGTTVLPELN